MSDIDAVIAASRRADAGFTERRTFRLARGRAIEKMRAFALADPHMYVLELVQAAVATGAKSIDISVDGGAVTVGWFGAGGFGEQTLAAIFDHLFASKEREDLAAARCLAVGLNAALAFAPTRIVVESGRGDRGPATRLEIDGGADRIDVGASNRSFSGTYVRIEGLVAGKGQGRGWGGEEGLRERRLLESHGAELPVPLVFQNEALFGFALQRIPSLYGHGKTLAFDEGDLYGQLAVARGEAVIKLLTFGVWIQSLEVEIIEGKRLAGIVNFDRLHKTVDHSGFVRDARFEEMVLRLRPHAQALLRGGATALPPATVRGADGQEIAAGELRSWLAGKGRVVVMPDDLDEGSPRWRRAQSIAERGGGEPLYVAPSRMAGVASVAASVCSVIVPDLSDDLDASFLCRPEDADFEAPLFVPPLRVALSPTPATAEIADGLLERAQLRLLAPRGKGPWSAGLWVRVVAHARVVHAECLPSTHPGHVLDTDMGPVLPSALRRAVGSSGLGELARTAAELVAPRLSELARHTLEAVGVGEIGPGLPGAHLVLAAVARLAHPQLVVGPAGVGLRLALPRPARNYDALGVPLVRTVAGQALTLRELSSLIDATGGLLYGMREDLGADLEGLDPGKILALDEPSEGALMTIFGAASYVRVDAREVVVRVEGCVLRDYAAGVRVRPDATAGEGGGPPAWSKALDLEPGGSTAPPSPTQVEALVAALVQRVRAPRGAFDPESLEAQRQAALHLAHHAFGPGLEEERGLRVAPQLEGMVVGRIVGGAPLRLGALLRRAAAGGQPLHVVFDGDAPFGHLHGDEVHGGEEDTIPASDALVGVSAWMAAAMVRMGVALRPGFALDLDPSRDSGAGGAGETRAPPGGAPGGWIVSCPVSGPGFSGLVGIPSGAPQRDALGFLGPEGRLVGAAPALCHRLGVSGVVRLRDPGEPGLVDAVSAAVDQAAASLWTELGGRLPGLDGPELARARSRALDFVGTHLRLHGQPTGRISARFDRAEAELLASSPLLELEHSAPLSVRRVVDRWVGLRTRLASDEEAWTRLGLVGDGVEAAWACRCLRLDAVAWPPARPPRHMLDASPSPGHALAFDDLAHSVAQWLSELRPDQQQEGSRVWLVAENRSIELRGMGLHLGTAHPLVADALTHGAERPAALARLLAATYGRINAHSLPVENGHEIEFLRRLAGALAAGELRMLVAPPHDPETETRSIDPHTRAWFEL